MDTKFKPGQSGNPTGRPLGAKNKIPANIKNVFLEAFEGTGGLDRFIEWIDKNDRHRAMFYGWITKMLPSSVVGGQDDEGEFHPLQVTIGERPTKD